MDVQIGEILLVSPNHSMYHDDDAQCRLIVTDRKSGKWYLMCQTHGADCWHSGSVLPSNTITDYYVRSPIDTILNLVEVVRHDD